MRRRQVIFYSWQAWLPGGTNRYFIEKALQNAVEILAGDGSLEIEPVIDRDTLGVAGAPDIASTILRKIAAADLFVADVSIVTAPGTRPIPNPNVLFELGYAVRALEAERIVQVQNTVYGGPEVLPFDLRGRRTLGYEAREGEADRSFERRRLEGTLVEALRLILQTAPRSIEPTHVEAAVSALEKDSVDSQRRLRAALQDILARLDSATPDWKANRGREGAVLLAALNETPPLLEDLARLAEGAAPLMEEKPPLRQPFLEFFGALLDRYGVGRENVPYQLTDFDFVKFHAHEFFTSFVALLLRDRRWRLIGEVLSASLAVKNRFVSYGEHEPVWRLSEYAELLAPERDVHFDVLQKRHTSGPLGELVPLEQFADADYLIFLSTPLRKFDDVITRLGGPRSDVQVFPGGRGGPLG